MILIMPNSVLDLIHFQGQCYREGIHQLWFRFLFPIAITKCCKYPPKIINVEIYLCNCEALLFGKNVCMKLQLSLAIGCSLFLSSYFPCTAFHQVVVMKVIKEMRVDAILCYHLCSKVIKLMVLFKTRRKDEIALHIPAHSLLVISSTFIYQSSPTFELQNCLRQCFFTSPYSCVSAK